VLYKVWTDRFNDVEEHKICVGEFISSDPFSLFLLLILNEHTFEETEELRNTVFSERLC